MYIDGDRLVVSIEADLNEVQELAAFAKPRLEFIDGIDFEEEAPESFGSSALFQLLASLKKSKPDLEIALFDTKDYTLGQLGIFRWGEAWTKND